MTTIAWDGKSMASDSMGLFGNLRVRRAEKLRILSDGSVAGGCGTADAVIAFMDWLADSDIEKPKFDGDEWPQILRAYSDGTCYRYDKYGRVPIADEFFSVGSGSEFAMGAMAMGASAKQAVEIAARFDSGSGGEILELVPSNKFR